MGNLLLYSDPNLRLEYCEEGRYMVERWQGVTPAKTFSVLVDVVLAFLLRRSPDGLVIDPTLHKGFGPDSQAYRAERIREYARAHGGIRQAIVTPADVFARFSVVSYSQQFGQGDPVQTRFFSRLDEAEAWIGGAG